MLNKLSFGIEARKAIADQEIVKRKKFWEQKFSSVNGEPMGNALKPKFIDLRSVEIDQGFRKT